MNKRFSKLIRFFNSNTGIAIIFGFVLLIIFSFNPFFEKKDKNILVDFDKKFQEKGKKLINNKRDISTENWEIYQDKKRGFELKYPASWIQLIIEENDNVAWEQKIVFRESSEKFSTKEQGFDIFVYNTNKIKKGTDVKVLGNTSSQNICFENQGCIEEGSFLVTKNEEYIYEIIPILPQRPIFSKNKDVPFFCNAEGIIVSMDSFKTINIVRPKPKPVITAPYPLSYKVVNGRLVCAKENDKPSKSKKDKGHHLDMECCLDPDEDPNPWCYYDPVKYGKYLK